MFNRMKKTLLMTTALVALTCGHNAFAENLPTDATNLTSGSYVVERSEGFPQKHYGRKSAPPMPLSLIKFFSYD